MAASGRLINRQSGYNRNLALLAALIALLSIWSILGSHVFVATNNINIDSRHLQSPNRLQRESDDASTSAGKASGGGSPKLESDRLHELELSRVKKSTLIDTALIIDTASKDDAPSQEKSKPNHSQKHIYNPPIPTNTSRRLLTYTRHGGRLNNQLIQFIGALQHATVLKRKLIIPDEKVAAEWTGLLDDNFDIWDLSSLKQSYDIDWNLGLDYERAEKERLLHSQIPKVCVLTKVQLASFLNGGIDHWRKWDEKCPDIMSLGKELPLCSPKHSFCGDAQAKLEAYKIYQHLKLSPYMQSLLPSPQPLSVHSRRAGEGGYDWEICTGPTKTICTSHIERKDWNRYCGERTLRGNCAIWTDLSYAIKSKRIWKEDEKQYRFNLASDGTHDWSIDYDGQFTMANSTPWLMHMDKIAYDKVINQKEPLQGLGRSFFIKERLQNEEDLLSKSHGIMYQLSSTILEMFSLVNAEYFVGGFYSTLSLNVCLLRGLDRIMDSNMCWMLIHPNSHYAIPPPMDQTVNIPTDNSQDEKIIPPALMSDVEHAFVANDNFFIVDRYRFMYRKPGEKTKIPTYIAVLGQGVVPMTIEKRIGGQDIIHANFTCSMGNQKDSRASIYILKDDGGSSIKDAQTLFIVCDDLKYDNDVTIQPPLILQSPDRSFSVSIGSHLVGPRNAPRMSWDRSISTYAVLVCLMPSYEDISTDSLESYLKHHESLGVKTHIDIYNVNWHSPQLQSILNDYRSKRKFVSRHDWSARAKSKSSSAADIFRNSLSRPAAKMDCMLRSRGVDEYALFGDIKDRIDKTVDAELKACQVNNSERCHISVNTDQLGLNEGDKSSNASVLTQDKYKRECVNIKSIEIAPWALM